MRVVGVNRSRIPVGARLPKLRRRSALLLVGIVLLGLLSSLYLSRFFEIRRLQNDLTVLRQREETALTEQMKLQARLALGNDPAALEEVARDKLGLVKPGEEKVIFVEGD